MEKKEVLKKLVNDIGVHTLSHILNINYNDLVIRNNHDYNDKITDNGLDIVLNHKDFKNKILDWIFPFDANGLTLQQESFVGFYKKSYEQLLILTESEEEINKIFSKSSLLLCCEREGYLSFTTKYVTFLSFVIMQSQKQDQIEKMFKDFCNIKKSDKTDLFPILNAFLKRNIPADEVFNSIQALNNSFLESKVFDYVIENNLSHTFELKQLPMYETEEKIVFEKTIKFNTNYFMALGLKENKVILALEKFCDLICNVDNINYLAKNKSKAFHLILRSENEEKINNLYNDIKKHCALISEFVQGYDQSQEYQSKFLTYWTLTNQFNNKKSTQKHKI